MNSLINVVLAIGVAVFFGLTWFIPYAEPEPPKYDSLQNQAFENGEGDYFEDVDGKIGFRFYKVNDDLAPVAGGPK